MPGFSARLLPLLTLGLLCLPAVAAPIVVDGIAVDLPADSTGWTSEKLGGGSLMLKREIVDDDGDKSVAMIQVGTRITQGAFEANLAAMLKIIPELADEDPTLDYDGTTPAGYRISMRDVCCGSRDGISISSIVVGVEMPDRSQRFLLLLTMGMGSDDKKVIESDFAYLARSLRPEGTAAAPGLAPIAGDGGLDGVFTTLRTGLTLNPFGGMDFNADSIILAFDKSGLFSHDIPAAGKSMADHCAARPDSCGTYRLDGGGLFGGPDKITMRDLNSDFAILESEQIAFARDGDGLKLGEEDYNHIPPFSRDTRFDGVWRFFWAQVGSGAFSSNSVSSERTLQMGRDGRFTMQGWSGFSSSNTIGDGTTSTAGSTENPAETGRYEVDGYTLRLLGDDGKEVLMSLFAPDIGSDGLLVLNGNNYLKQDD